MEFCGTGTGQGDIRLGWPDLSCPCVAGLDGFQIYCSTKNWLRGIILTPAWLYSFEGDSADFLICLFLWIQQIKSLGNMALQAHVFEHLLSILKTPYFSGDRVSWKSISHSQRASCTFNVLLQPVASMSKCIVHTLLTLCISTFNEESLGNPQVCRIID